MYHNMFAVAVQVDGKVVREYKDRIYIPYGSEYSLMLKNLNVLNAQVKISIDGNDVLNGDSLVVYANQSVNLERYLTNTNKGNRFKFIERTASVEKHRGSKVEDGLIRIEFQFEKQRPPLKTSYYRSIADSPFYGDLLNTRRLTPTGIGGSSTGDTFYATSTTTTTLSYAPTDNEVGITVPGSISNQQFEKVDDFILDGVKHVMVIHMLGETEDNKKVSVPVTVKRNVTCSSCGRKNKQTSKFCVECGTALDIIK